MATWKTKHSGYYILELAKGLVRVEVDRAVGGWRTKVCGWTNFTLPFSETIEAAQAAGEKEAERLLHTALREITSGKWHEAQFEIADVPGSFTGYTDGEL